MVPGDIFRHDKDIVKEQGVVGDFASIAREHEPRRGRNPYWSG